MSDNLTKKTISVQDAATEMSRRSFIKGGALLTGAALMGLVAPSIRNAAWAAGSDAPEKTDVKIGFIPLTDCASVVMASVKGFDKKYGINIIPSKEASWAGVRDKLTNGELDASHVLYGLIYGLQMGIGGPQKDMAVLMNLNHNGQAITLSNALKDKGVMDGTSLRKLISSDKREYTFAQTFPTGTHAMWLYYWLAAHDINPFSDVKNIVVPPPQMVANMRVGNMDGFCVGEPWNARAIMDKIGFTVTTTQDIWQEHPEKVLGTTKAFVEQYPNTARAMVAAILDASKFIDASVNRREVAETVASKAYINCPVDVIDGRMAGKYDNGAGKTWDDPHAMKFFDEGKVNYPYLSDGMWFMTQHKRWGLVKDDPDYLSIAKSVNRIDVYKDAAAMAKVATPTETMRTSKLMDGKVWDGSNPAAYAASFAVKA
ncbi:MAG: ABC transporter substrate-binding protein [Thiotrichales bacterium]|nr:ABC transporter substrate-binding protein [Thiotrichales bacterium]